MLPKVFSSNSIPFPPPSIHLRFSPATYVFNDSSVYASLPSSTCTPNQTHINRYFPFLLLRLYLLFSFLLFSCLIPHIAKSSLLCALKFISTLPRTRRILFAVAHAFFFYSHPTSSYPQLSSLSLLPILSRPVDMFPIPTDLPMYLCNSLNRSVRLRACTLSSLAGGPRRVLQSNPIQSRCLTDRRSRFGSRSRSVIRNGF